MDGGTDCEFISGLETLGPDQDVQVARVKDLWVPRCVLMTGLLQATTRFTCTHAPPFTPRPEAGNRGGGTPCSAWRMD